MNPEDLLVKHGLKPTPTLIGVIRMFESGSRMTPEEIFKRMLGTPEVVSLPTVYRMLAKLHRGKILDRHDIGARAACFSLTSDSRPLHLICDRCGAIEAFNDELIEGQLSSYAARSHFDVRETTLRLCGLCRECSQRVGGRYPASNSSPQ